MSWGVTDIAALAGPGIGGGIGLWALLRFARWGVEFAFKRSDLRADRMDARERALELRYDDRLRHVEEELQRTREALMLLLNDVARNNPANPVLQRVAELLGTNDRNVDGSRLNPAPPTERDPYCDSLLSKLRDVPGTKR